MVRSNKFDESFPAEEEIIDRIKEIAEELRSNFDERISLDNFAIKKYLQVSNYYAKNNPKRLLIDFAKSLNIVPALKGKDFPGVYVFAQKNQNGEFKFLYAGISRNIIERVNSHVNRKDSGTATWAYRMAKSKYQTDKKDKNAKIPENEIKLKISEIQRTEIALCYVSFIHEPDNFIMHIAEGYVACALKCEWNSFKTH